MSPDYEQNWWGYALLAYFYNWKVFLFCLKMATYGSVSKGVFVFKVYK